MSRYLFVIWSGGGNVGPQLIVAKRLLRRGHDVTVLGPRSLGEAVEASGATFAAYVRGPEHDLTDPARDSVRDWEVGGLKAAARVRDAILFGPAPGVAADVMEVIERERPDVLAPDFLMLGAFAAGEAAGLPVAGLVHSLLPLPRAGVPAYGSGMTPLPGPLGRLRDGLLNRMVMVLFGRPLPELNRLRASLGLGPVASLAGVYDRAHLVMLTSWAFDFPAPLPANASYAGVQVDPDAPSPAPPEPGDRPRVLVSLSTTYMNQGPLLRRLIAAAAALPAQVVVTLGPALRAEDFPAPANVELHGWLPHDQVMPGAALVVTHAGHGTVTAALRHGVPLLCLPMGRDQGDNAARVVWHGAGLRGSPAASEERLGALMRKALLDQGLREGARRLAAALAEDNPDAAAHRLEAMAGPARREVGAR